MAGWFLCIFLHFVPLAAWGIPLAEVAREPRYNLAGKLEILRDPTARLEIRDVAGAGSGNFAPLPGLLAASPGRDAVWLRLDLDRAGADAADWVLEVSPSFLDEVSVHVADGQGGFKRLGQVEQMAFGDRLIAHRHFAFPLELPPGRSTVYLRLQTRGPMAADAYLLTRPEFQRHLRLGDLFSGFYYGTLALFLVFNLIFWFGLRDRLYLCYATYLAVLTLRIFFMDGYASEWLLPQHSYLADQAGGLLVALSYAALTWFMDSAMEFRYQLRRLHLFHRLCIGLYLLACVAALFGLIPVLTPLLHSLLVLQLAASIVAGLWLQTRGRRQISLYVLAFAIILVAELVLPLRAHGLVPMDALVEASMNWGNLLHLLVLNVALAHRVRLADENRRRAEASARQAEQALEAEVIERTELLRRTNDYLLQEITERESLQRQLQAALATERQALESQREFVSMVSHEFRTPLAVIDATAQSLELRTAPEDESTHRRLEKIRRAVSRLTTLLENCLSEDRLAAPSLELRRHRLDLRDLVENVAATIRGLQNRPLQLEMTELPLPADGDSQLLAVALGNLVDNALKYTPPDRKVLLRAQARENRAEIEVMDEGPGIAPEDQGRIFEKFYRSETTKTVSGAGLGLYLAREIARRHGGDLVLDAAYREGCLFRLILPLNLDPATGAA